MSCKPTGPLNIEHNNNTKSCFKKCRFQYDFKKSEVIAKNKGDYISIRLKNKDDVGAKFSSTNTPNCSNGGESSLSVQELRVYKGSLHTYGSKREKTDGELIIILSNTSGGREVIVCIPISTTNGNLPTASKQLSNIITYLSKAGNNNGEGGEIKGLNFDLNSFIPVSKGFYNYSASLPWDPCDKCVDYIVYNKKDVLLALDNFTMRNLNSLLNTIDTPKPLTDEKSKFNAGYSYNQKGAIYTLGDANDKIYINCRPTGSDGKVLIDESKSDVLSNNSFGVFSGLKQSTFEKIFTWSILILAIFIVTGVLIFVMQKGPAALFDLLSPKQQSSNMT